MRVAAEIRSAGVLAETIAGADSNIRARVVVGPSDSYTVEANGARTECSGMSELLRALEAS
jgi:hypothetical protein